MRETFFKRVLSVGFIILRHFSRQNIMVRDVQKVAIIVFYFILLQVKTQKRKTKLHEIN